MMVPRRASSRLVPAFALVALLCFARIDHAACNARSFGLPRFGGRLGGLVGGSGTGGIWSYFRPPGTSGAGGSGATSGGQSGQSGFGSQGGGGMSGQPSSTGGGDMGGGAMGRRDTPGEHSPLVGFLADGIPLYGPRGAGGELPSGVDECGGHVGDGSAGEPAFYHYHASSTAPYTVACLKGCVSSSDWGTLGSASCTQATKQYDYSSLAAVQAA
ncbi:unnamed protein product [Closterium sp. NIES-54]